MTTLTYQKPSEIDSRRIRVSLIDIPAELEPEDSLVEDDTLRRSIGKSGVQQSIHLINAARGRFTLVDGARRVLISRLEELEYIPAIVWTVPEGVDETEFRNKLRMILHNRQDLLPTQRAGLINQLMDGFQMSQKAVAEYLGVNEGTVSNWVSILEYVPEIQRAIDTGQINLFSGRGFDGLTPEGQKTVWRNEKDRLIGMAGKNAHKYIRDKYSPKKRPELYVHPEHTLEKLERKQRGRKSRHRPRLTHDEKEKLSRDLKLREVELKDGRAELAQLKKEIALAAPVVNAIMRNPELKSLIPPEILEEFSRFVEIF